jgi:hypothetical protein
MRTLLPRAAKAGDTKARIERDTDVHIGKRFAFTISRGDQDAVPASAAREFKICFQRKGERVVLMII